MEDSSLAEELADKQRSISVSEFFEKNKHMLGFDSEARSIITAVKEGVDNALDATEEARKLPDVYISVKKDGEYYKVTIEDNGPGLPEENIPKVFGKLLYGSRFGAREQNRGQQGIGISAAVLYSQMTSGEPARIKSKTADEEEAKYVELTLDTDSNEPNIQKFERINWDKESGTRIELTMEANMRARQTLLQYVRNTAVVNPHARIELDEPKGNHVYERGTDELPEPTEEVKPHPHGVDLGTLMKMLDNTDSYSIKGFLENEFTKVGSKSADKIIDRFRDEYYGKEMQWDTEMLIEEDLKESVREAISGKKEEEVTFFTDKIFEMLQDFGEVSYTDVEAIVSSAGEQVEDEYDTRFGDTVRDKALSSIWNQVRTTVYDTLHQLVETATSERKDDNTVGNFAFYLGGKFYKTNKRDRITPDTLKDYVEETSEETETVTNKSIGDTARDNIVDTLWDHMLTVNDEVPNVKELSDNRVQQRALLNAMGKVQISRPSSKCLSPIKPELIEKGLKKEYDADFYAASSRDASVHSGSPFIAEAGIAYGGEIEDGSVDILRYANKVPLVYQQGACTITKVIKDIGWRNYELNQKGNQGIPDGPAVIVVHVASTNVPFTSESKDAIASDPEINQEIERAVREVGRSLKKYLKKQQSLSKRREKNEVIAKYLPEIAKKASHIAERSTPNIEKSLAKIMNNILIKRTVDDGKVTLNVKNYSNSKGEISLELTVPEKPTYPSDELTREKTDNGWELSWTGSLDKSEEIILNYKGEEPEVNIKNLEPEKYTII